MEATRQEKYSKIALDVKVALDTVFFPLDIDCWYDDYGYGENVEDEPNCIDYTPPFYLAEKCNEQHFGVVLMGTDYPLTCTSEISTVNFTVQNSADWINHVDKFVWWLKECQELIAKIRA